MDVKATDIPGVLLLKPRFFHDVRGFFVETYNMHAAREAGLQAEFVQDNQALSLKRGTVRAALSGAAARARQARSCAARQRL